MSIGFRLSLRPLLPALKKRLPHVNMSSLGDRDLAVASFSLSARPALFQKKADGSVGKGETRSLDGLLRRQSSQPCFRAKLLAALGFGWLVEYTPPLYCLEARQNSLIGIRL